MQIAGSEDILLFCAFIIISILVSSLCKSWLGAIAGFIAGIADIALSHLIFSFEILTLSGLAKLLILCLTGFITGHYSSKYRAQRFQMARQREELSEARLELKRAGASQDSQDIFSRNSLYGKVLETLRNNDPVSEELVWIIIRHMLDSDKPSVICMDILHSLNPRILAVIRPDGRIVAYNTTIMALLGYSFRDNATGKNILDLVQAQDTDAASVAIKRIHEPGFSGSERFAVKTLREQFVESVVFPTVSFKPAGGGQSAYAQINPGQAFSARKDDPFLDMAVNGIWWIDADGNTDFITGSLAKLFGYLPDEMHAKSITAFLQAGDADTFIELLNSCADGQPRYQRLGFVHKNGSIIAMQIRTHTIFGASRHFAGLILNLEDTANLAKTEKALFYRLSMEEMIADISSRFVGIKYKKIDGEIVNSLKKIEEFMGVRDSSVQLTLDPSYEEKAPGTADILIWQSSNSSDSSLTGVPAQPYKSEESLTIPLLAGTRPIGVFRCTQSTYTKEWMSEDIRLIQLAGEIFINAITGRENQLKLILSEERLRVTLNSIGDAIIAIDENNVIQMFNSTAEHLIGINKYNALGKYLNEIFITRLVLENPEKPDETSYTKLEALDGQSRFISVQRYPITDTDKNIYGEIIIFSDVSEKKKREDEIRYISFHDTLTNLYNRVFFEEEMRRLDVKRQHPITIIMGDCNGLKITNDVFGHYEGDRLLVRTAEILLKSTRKEDVVARWGGDEFVIILPKTDEKTASQIRERILETCENTDMHPVKPSLALGSATKADDSVTMDTLLKEAEERMYRHKLLESKSARNSIISSFEKMLYERNYETEEHAKRMQDMAHSFGLYVGLSDDELDNFCLLAALHDIGKIGIPDHILLKPGELSSDEWAQMKKHSEKGFSIANSTGELNNIADLILYHHERWDGTGYPQGLRGEEIPRLARMLSVIDAYDVITHARPYKEPLNKSDALLEIEHCASTQFDPALVKSFVMLMRAKDREAAYQS